MKHLLAAFFALCWLTSTGQSVGINTNTPDNSAVLDVQANDRGILTPRMTTVERDAIAAPANGLLVYNTTTNCFDFYDGGSWQSICGAPITCDFSNAPATSDVFIDQGSSGTLDIAFTTIGGMPGDIFTFMDNPTALPWLTLTSVTNNNTPPPMTQTLTLDVAAGAPIGNYTLLFRHDANCGVQRVTVVTLRITGCDFNPSLSNSFPTADPGDPSQNISLFISQAGTNFGTATTVVNGLPTGTTVNVLNDGCGYTCTQSLILTVGVTTPSGTYPLDVEVTSSCGTVKTVPMVLSVSKYSSCKEIFDAGLSTGDGVYSIDPDGAAGPLPDMQVYCDMTTDGGGWTLLLNYSHRSGTNPPTNPLTGSFPIPTTPAPALGTDQSTLTAVPAAWGHTAPVVINQMPMSELRFSGLTSELPGSIFDFKTPSLSARNYFKTGTGTINNADFSCPTCFTFLPGHDPAFLLPASTGITGANQGNNAMTSGPFRIGGGANGWNIGRAGRWTIDNGSPGNANTIHQIWCR